MNYTANLSCDFAGIAAKPKSKSLVDDKPTPALKSLVFMGVPFSLEKEHVVDCMRSMFTTITKLRDADISPHGERVLVITHPGASVKQSDAKFWLNAEYAICRESTGKLIYNIPLLWESEHLNREIDWVEAIRCLIQCAESGVSATESDIAALSRNITALKEGSGSFLL